MRSSFCTPSINTGPDRACEKVKSAKLVNLTSLTIVFNGKPSDFWLKESRFMIAWYSGNSSARAPPKIVRYQREERINQKWEQRELKGSNFKGLVCERSKRFVLELNEATACRDAITFTRDIHQ